MSEVAFAFQVMTAEPLSEAFVAITEHAFASRIGQDRTVWLMVDLPRTIPRSKSPVGVGFNGHL